MFNSYGDKNDPGDAAVILEMLKQGRVQIYVDPLIAGHHDLQGTQDLLSGLRAGPKCSTRSSITTFRSASGNAQILGGKSQMKVVDTFHDRISNACSRASAELRGLLHSRVGSWSDAGQQGRKSWPIWSWRRNPGAPLPRGRTAWPWKPSRNTTTPSKVCEAARAELEARAEAALGERRLRDAKTSRASNYQCR